MADTGATTAKIGRLREAGFDERQAAAIAEALDDRERRRADVTRHPVAVALIAVPLAFLGWLGLETANLKAGQAALNVAVGGLKADVDELKADVDELKTGQVALRTLLEERLPPRR